MATPRAQRETQTIRLSSDRLDRFREWATQGTALTAAGRVRSPDDRVALVRNAWSDGWLPPGGAVERGEDLRSAAAREIREETGLDPAVGDPLLAVDQTYVDATSGEAAFSATYVLYDATASGEIPDADRLGVGDDEIGAARWFDSLPAALHDDELLRPYLRVDGVK